ncbi:hypothetical protein [Rhizobium oryzicola]|uniref:Uncharacterized protein n=1 Tax=Rhizobium oryzicola TaxID=1232668 RepID=A0ABT8SZ37_9HYPH|nr:hypothetical protein [Rhizobium oryzicola]MDO1583535.1 hypothetical protein [Rhizobium oryzicola]
MSHFPLRLSLSLVLILAGSASAASPVVIEESGVAPIKIGMTLKEAKGAIKSLKPFGTDKDECRVARVVQPKMDLLIENGKVTRIYVTDKTLSTAKGIHVGSSEADLKKAYGAALKIEPGKYDDKSHSIQLLGANGVGIGFETDGKMVKEISVGTAAALQYVEKCG